ncbi:tetratricopeptide repeat protein [Nitrincola alkalisediminis]|uniref:tetratricopeptide repeat protein n=1 Tax=Nitrincola alkalisediminis TaxID=1366656 RepID=UPI0018738AB1|nr:tetratricopeptide repeat protein [Nitrincola alkalisediminis]
MNKIQLILPCLLLSCITGLAHSDTLPLQSNAVHSQEAINDYYDAVKKLEQGQYQEAYELFEKLFLQMPDSLAINVMMARAAMAQGMYDEALTALDRALILDPNNAPALLEMARLYYELKQYSLAASEVEKALNQPLPDTVRTQAQDFLAVVNTRQNRHHLVSTLMLGLQYDDNANNDIGSSTHFQLPGFGNISLSGQSEQEDFGFTQALRFDHTYDFGLRGGWYLDNQLVLLNRNHKNIHKNDLFYISASVAPTLATNAYKFGIPFFTENILLNYDQYLNISGSGFEYRRVITPQIQFLSYYRTSLLKYASPRQNRDAWSNQVGVELQTLFGPKSTRGTIGVDFEHRDQRNSHRHTSDPTSYEMWTVRTELSHPLSQALRASLGFTYQETDYKQRDVLFANTRSDTLKHLDASLLYSLDTNSAVSFAVSEHRRRSNQKPNSYDKTLVSMNYLLRF